MLDAWGPILDIRNILLVVAGVYVLDRIWNFIKDVRGGSGPRGRSRAEEKDDEP